MWGSVWACAMKHNDLGTLNMSGLGEYLLDVLPSVQTSEGNSISMAVYGDSIFRPSYSILRKIDNPKNDAEKLLNQRLNKCRTSVEMLYGDLFNLFTLLSTKRKLKLLKNGRHVRKLIIVSFFLQNCHTCLNVGNCVTSMFGSKPPTIDEYLPLDEEIVCMDIGDDEIPLGYTYDYGGVAKKYKPFEDIRINIDEGSLLHNDQMINM